VCFTDLAPGRPEGDNDYFSFMLIEVKPLVPDVIQTKVGDPVFLRPAADIGVRASHKKKNANGKDHIILHPAFLELSVYSRL
jgi:hypothetical protein